MAQKFGNFRWVNEGFLDGREEGIVVGNLSFAGIGPVDFCLKGHLTGEIAGKAIKFVNSHFIDDPRAAEVLADFDIPQIGNVSLISFDPHPLLAPHPYIEWFSLGGQHYRIELGENEAWILTDDETESLDRQSESIRSTLRSRLESSSEEMPSETPNEWF